MVPVHQHIRDLLWNDGILEPPNKHYQPENILLNVVAAEASRHISFLMSDALCNMNLILIAHEALNIIPLFTRYTVMNIDIDVCCFLFCLIFVFYMVFLCNYLCFVSGVHDEGSTIKSLFGLIFWDIIYEHPVPDVFRSSYQHVPLDLRSGEFYRNRKERIDKRLEALCRWDMKYVQDYVEKIFKENEGKESVVNWQRFRNLQQIVVSEVNFSTL